MYHVGCFSMEGRLDDYRWAGPYMMAVRWFAVNENSDIYKLEVTWRKEPGCQSTTKPEGIFLKRTEKNSQTGKSDQSQTPGTNLCVSEERLCRCSWRAQRICCPVST